ncbi:hypothetical protein CMT75_18830 [Elizabethkingia anophelis]|nr:hypothetical protein [Elizabethkingia anophelis]
MLIALAIIIIIGLVIVIYYLRSILTKLSSNEVGSKSIIPAESKSEKKNDDTSIIKKNVMTFDHIGTKVVKESEQNNASLTIEPISEGKDKKKLPELEKEIDPISDAYNKMQSQTQYDLDILSDNYEDLPISNEVESINISSITEIEEKEVVSAEDLVLSILNSENDLSDELKNNTRDYELKKSLELDMEVEKDGDTVTIENVEIKEKEETSNLFKKPNDNALNFSNMNTSNLFE